MSSFRINIGGKSSRNRKLPFLAQNRPPVLSIPHKSIFSCSTSISWIASLFSCALHSFVNHPSSLLELIDYDRPVLAEKVCWAKFVQIQIPNFDWPDSVMRVAMDCLIRVWHCSKLVQLQAGDNFADYWRTVELKVTVFYIAF